MKLTYAQAYEVASEAAVLIGCMVEGTVYISGKYWSIDDFVFEIAVGDEKVKLEISGNLLGDGFPNV